MMSISSLGGVPAIAPQDLSIASTLGASTGPASIDGGAGFGASLSTAIDGLQGMQATSNELAIKAVTGDLQDIHDATIASTQAQVTLELIAAVRNKGVDAFNEIMRMQA